MIAANPGMAAEILDVQNPAELKSFATTITARYPTLNVLVNMTGIMKPESLSQGGDLHHR